ncbi:hypothetical protein [Planomonospora venezuelensis]|uniref:Uncharacterized protein n=1 Tax=Planomonospora venezuelensis TaxID=1999 RepID=A0A841D2L9_PLAVE|nr:hypothetical protein [Planomonospora venezuelensis]MBB5964030.1 hypothetical protein [Planomonospora venezuelensis]GIM99652.1 hypothetical protein Pve01_13110 [Planomonospora venezuelensis]
MNDRPDRLVYGRPAHPGDGSPGEDTQPNIPPQRGDAERPGSGEPSGRPGGVPGRETAAATDPDLAEAARPVPEEHADRVSFPQRADLDDRPVPPDAEGTGPVHADRDPSAPEHADLENAGPGDRPEHPAGPSDPAHGGPPAAVPDPAPQHAARTPLFDRDPEDVRRRWQEVQVGFVDDPRDAVERAHSLLDELSASIRTALETRAAELQALWKDGGDNDTERLRTALRDYRSTLEELLGLPVTSTGKR